jgi:outer membrane immunogenic protein
MLKIKKNLLILLITTTTATFAGTMGATVIETPCMKEGLYVGAGIGGSMYNNNFSVYNTSTLFQVNRSFSSSDAQASVFAGVGKTYYDKYYLGVEANSYFPSHTAIWTDRPGVTQTSLQFNTSLQTQNYVNLDLLPGYRVSPEWLIYGRAGVSFSNISLNQEPISTSPSYSQTHSKIGGRFGAGIAYQITDHVGAGVDYYYSYIPKDTHNFYGREIGYQLNSYWNYVGFSLFYTV